MATQLQIRSCPKCDEDRKVLGRGVMIKVDGVDQEVCEVCGLPSVKSHVEKQASKTRDHLLRWSELDLSKAQGQLEDAESYIKDAEEKLPDDWQEVAGNCRMARMKADAALRTARTDTVTILLKQTQANLDKAGQVKSAKKKKKEREDDQKRLDILREKIEKGLSVSRQSLEDSQNMTLRWQDRESLLTGAVRQAAQAFFRSKSYLDDKDEANVERLVEQKLGKDDSEGEPQDEERQ